MPRWLILTGTHIPFVMSIGSPVGSTLLPILTAAYRPLTTAPNFCFSAVYFGAVCARSGAVISTGVTERFVLRPIGSCTQGVCLLVRITKSTSPRFVETKPGLPEAKGSLVLWGDVKTFAGFIWRCPGRRRC